MRGNNNGGLQRRKERSDVTSHGHVTGKRLVWSENTIWVEVFLLILSTGSDICFEANWKHQVSKWTHHFSLDQFKNTLLRNDTVVSLFSVQIWIIEVSSHDSSDVSDRYDVFRRHCQCEKLLSVSSVCTFCFSFFPFGPLLSPTHTRLSACVTLDQLAPCSVVPGLHSHALCWKHTLPVDGVEGTISHKKETSVCAKCNHCHGNKDWNLW